MTRRGDKTETFKLSKILLSLKSFLFERNAWNQFIIYLWKQVRGGRRRGRENRGGGEGGKGERWGRGNTKEQAVNQFASSKIHPAAADRGPHSGCLICVCQFLI